MFLKAFAFFVFLTWATVSGKRKLKVLVYSPSIGYSHMQYQGKLADLLVEAGHEVVRTQYCTKAPAAMRNFR